MPTELVKATITILEGRNKNQDITVHFNPTEYAVEYGATFQETPVPGLSNPILQFVNGAAEMLSMDLLFDTWTDGGGRDVSEDTAEFVKMLQIDGDTHAPPRVEFKWGVFRFKAVVEKISQRFTMFQGDGTPVRATLNVTFKQYRSIAEQLDNPRRNSADKTKERVLGKVEGWRPTPEALWSLSADEYGEARFWRQIARANRIDDPRTLSAGDKVSVPPLTDFGRTPDGRR
ncbi:LysM peptidoglycan-binding domain-containing protein [Rhodobacterales bacterium HKCCE3408]|nr:LysM peptidoglycan-binding domain-containing protein [Rhodobacterales bacterium HKCCE3408]